MPPSPPRRERRAPLPPADPLPARKVSLLGVRRAAVARFGVWAALAAGPVALLASCGGRPAPAVSERPAAVTRTVQPGTAAESGPAGYAELILGLWLGAGSDGNGTAARQLRLLAPSVRPPQWGRQPVTVERLAAVRTVRQNADAWSVTVAAQLSAAAQMSGSESAAGLRYFTIPVVFQQPGTSGAMGFVAAGAPMEVAGPSAGKMPASPYGSALEGGPVADSVTGFLAAFLSAEGGADRYLAPGVDLPGLEAGGYIAVESGQLLADRRTDDQEHNKDGATVRVQAEVTATDSAGRKWPLSYALSMRARAGRWEVAALDTGLGPAASAPAKPTAPSASSPRSTGPAVPVRTPAS